MRSLLCLIVTCLVLGPAAAAETYRASSWVRTAGAEARLILSQAGVSSGPLWGGIEIRLAPGAKTYWRSPGETGVAPVADFAGSRGVKPPVLAFPLPVAFDDGAGGTAIGYTSDLILPFRIEPLSGAGRISVAVKLEFGICQKSLCMPAEAMLRLAPGEGADEAGLAVRMAETLAMVPVPRALGSTERPAIVTADARQQGTDLMLTITARTLPGDSAPSLFVEGDDVYAVRLESVVNGEARFSARTRREATASGKPLSLLMTLGSNNSAIETAVTLDVGAVRP
ncbi:MAG TPA: protein-disulfide reductase DsbD family protein [Beijerinckiaceae bacterium]|nr:protein-disulfide reductase DsbD family protein [Beijerinckiaceae bacterium]